MIHVQIILMGFGQSAGDADAGIKTGRIITNDDQNYSYYPCVPEGNKTLGGGDELTQYVMVSHRLVVIGLEGHADDQATGGE